MTAVRSGWSLLGTRQSGLPLPDAPEHLLGAWSVEGHLQASPVDPMHEPARSRPEDERWIWRAVELARRGLGRTSPNPTVGAVLVKDGLVVGEGYHPYAGGSHAEVVALRAAGERARGATLYVTLEPCAHFGRTPPCVDAIIAAGVARVVACTIDPNPRVNGRGFSALRAAGIPVALSPEPPRQRVRRLNAAYEKFITAGMPYVTLKVAMTLDGKAADAAGCSRWISNARSRALVHRMRAQSDAVMVGAGTALRDDPLLTARPRTRAARQPLRVVVDSRARLSDSARMFAAPAPAGPVVVATTTQAPPDRLRRLSQAGAQLLLLPPGPDGRVDLRALFAELGRREVTSVLVEGGPTLSGALLSAGLIDTLLLFVAPMILGGTGALSVLGGAGAGGLGEAWRLSEWRIRRIAAPDGGPGDLLVEAHVGAAQAASPRTVLPGAESPEKGAPGFAEAAAGKVAS